MSWHPFNASNKAGSCKWCGRKLRQKYETKYAYTKEYRPPSECHWCPAGRRAKFKRSEDEPTRFECEECGSDSQGKQKRKLLSRTKTHNKPGDYGDGHFCGLNCGYNFAVAVANQGSRLKPR